MDGPQPEQGLVGVVRQVADTGHVVVEVLRAVPAPEEVSDVVDHGGGHCAHPVVAPGKVLIRTAQSVII